MNLLEKFAAVEINADDRITEADRAFCEKNQAAYEAALVCFKELAFFWNDMVGQQIELLGDVRLHLWKIHACFRVKNTVDRPSLFQHQQQERT